MDPFKAQKISKQRGASFIKEGSNRAEFNK